MNRQALLRPAGQHLFVALWGFAGFGCEGDGEAGRFEGSAGHGGFWEIC